MLRGIPVFKSYVNLHLDELDNLGDIRVDSKEKWRVGI